ncbi:MAG: hypothetical protein ACETWB_06450 [Anaerolineae bacterium]
MSGRKRRSSRRYCEECGEPIESKRKDVFLCRECSRLQAEEKQRARKSRKTFRRARQPTDEQY